MEAQDEMIPASNAHLRIGDACFMPLPDGRYVPFIYVGKRGKDRAYFFGALADAVVNAPEIDQLPPRIMLGQHALVHIKCYRENRTPIVGNVLDRLDGKQIEHIASDIVDSGVGHVTRVWGWRTIAREAIELAESGARN